MSQIFERSHVLSTMFHAEDHQAVTIHICFIISSSYSNLINYFKLLQEFESMKQSENGWKECIQYLMNNNQIQ